MKFTLHTIAGGKRAPQKFKVCECCGEYITKRRICLEDDKNKRYVCLACVVAAYSKATAPRPWWQFWKKAA